MAVDLVLAVMFISTRDAPEAGIDGPGMDCENPFMS